MKETNLNINDIIRIKAMVLDSNYPDELVNKIVDGLDDLFKKSEAFNRILQVDNQATDKDRMTGKYESDIETVINKYKERADGEEQ